ncbi:MAG: iron-sulfur cluster assembly scaffold protein [Candidatus Babeliaceae bacterium]|jgi:nitrogen fixation NifU-like protein
MKNTLYHEILMDHYKHPRHYGTLDNPTFTVVHSNQSCGDSITFEGIIRNNILEKVAFVGKGCVISQASASLLAESVCGLAVDCVQKLHVDHVMTLLGNSPLGPVRMKCALLALEALHKGVSLHAQ